MKTRLHRNNAAEWVMLIALTPIAWTLRLMRKLRAPRASTEPSGPTAGSHKSAKPKRSVMIEGLPPRTMN